MHIQYISTVFLYISDVPPLQCTCWGQTRSLNIYVIYFRSPLISQTSDVLFLSFFLPPFLLLMEEVWSVLEEGFVKINVHFILVVEPLDNILFR